MPRDVEPQASVLPAWFTRLCTHPRLPLWLALTAVVLTSGSLWMGFHLDDFVHRYMLSDRPGAAELLRAYESPFGIANGEPAINRWQIEHGYAPWWIERDLLVSLWRPISYFTHEVDAALWPDNAFAMHVQSLLWFGALIFAVALLYRRLLSPPLIAGLAALFYAVNHTHGFAVGWIANRNALVAGLLGVIALSLYVAGRHGSRVATWTAPIGLLSALLAGEASLGALGYMIAHALFLDRASALRRALALAPHLLVVVAWRVVYSVLGHGAHGSGLYIDPVREPVSFIVAASSRLPLLLMGQLALPPAETYVIGPAAWAPFMLGFALVISLLFALAVIPLLRADATARFWFAGMLMSLVPSCTTYASNRLLIFSGLGAMALLAQLWIGFVTGAGWLPTFKPQRVLAHVFVGAAAVLHLFLSPLLLPLTTRSVAFTRPINQALAPLSNDPQLSTRRLLVLCAPEHFFVKLIPALRALADQPPLRALDALSFGAVELRLTRSDARTLVVDYAGGILKDSSTHLYRHPGSAMHVGERFDYRDVEVEVLGVEPDGRAKRVRFTFERDLDVDPPRVVSWRDARYVDTALPQVGASITLPAASLPLQIP